MNKKCPAVTAKILSETRALEREKTYPVRGENAGDTEDDHNETGEGRVWFYGIRVVQHLVFPGPGGKVCELARFQTQILYFVQELLLP